MAGRHHMHNHNESDAMIMDIPLPTNTLSKKKVGAKGKGNKENPPTPFCNATSVVLALSTEDDLDEDPVETLLEPEKHVLLVCDIKEDKPPSKCTKKQPLKQLNNGLDMQKFLSKKKSKKEELIEVNARIVELGAIIMSMKDKEKLQKSLIAELAKHKAPLPPKVIAKPLGQEAFYPINQWSKLQYSSTMTILTTVTRTLQIFWLEVNLMMRIWISLCKIF
ncbi:hypothetical protein DACRYDRAFT_107477 [Dacryopinax primogenitus]|uniref:Uncharacterized protein n=1 Tax=Dacryopinax primogenitus (strain DJM 731) TaxID=1858805 RepID=M5FVC1_DACPD|nr:uncharacterized protein DACRYDRAFT_107477 [Dacryopinax primogenitus]EJU01736.1 hypothetical protein DACRYDRAFT_107477 [Dacryopinax primogenitus]